MHPQVLLVKLNTKQPFSTHEAVNHPVSLYAATKKSNELMARAYSHLYNLPTTGLDFLQFTVHMIDQIWHFKNLQMQLLKRSKLRFLIMVNTKETLHTLTIL